MHVHCTATERRVFRKANIVGEMKNKKERENFGLLSSQVKKHRKQEMTVKKAWGRWSLSFFRKWKSRLRQHRHMWDVTHRLTSALTSFKWVRQEAGWESFSLLLLLWLPDTVWTPHPEFGYCLVFSLYDIKSINTTYTRVYEMCSPWW